MSGRIGQEYNQADDPKSRIAQRHARQAATRRTGAFIAAAAVLLIAGLLFWWGRRQEPLTPFTSDAGKFSVGMPEQPEVTEQNGTIVFSAEAAKGRAACVVSYIDGEPGKVDQSRASEAYDVFANEVITRMHAIPGAKRDITVGTHAGREYTAKPMKDGGFNVRLRAFLVGDRLYSVYTAWESGVRGFEPTADAFLNSFRLLD